MAHPPVDPLTGSTPPQGGLHRLSGKAGGDPARWRDRGSPLLEAQGNRVGQLRVFEGAVAIITGGASGIGNALGEALAGRGCEVVLADLDGERAENAAAAICLRGLKATAASVDVTDFAAIRKTIDETMRRCGRTL